MLSISLEHRQGKKAEMSFLILRMPETLAAHAPHDVGGLIFAVKAAVCPAIAMCYMNNLMVFCRHKKRRNQNEMTRLLEKLFVTVVKGFGLFSTEIKNTLTILATF